MNRTMYRICMAMVLVVTFAAGVAQATQVAKGEVTDVTVYRDQALAQYKLRDHRGLWKFW